MKFLGRSHEGQLIQVSTFINSDYPVEILTAKKHRKHEGLVGKFEFICNGKEICYMFF